MRKLLPFVLLGVPASACAYAQTFPPEELRGRMVQRRAVDAAIWGLPTISFDAMRQAFFRDGKATWTMPDLQKLQ